MKEDILHSTKYNNIDPTKFYDTIIDFDSLKKSCEINKGFNVLFSDKGYQNYISQKGISIANCYRNLYSNPLQYAYNLLEENIFDSTNVKIINN